MSFAHVTWKGWAALAVFAVQNGCAVLLMRWSKINQPEPYSSQVAVLVQEAAVKLPISILLYVLECGGVLAMGRSIANDLRERYVEWLQLGVPAILYTIQNTLLYVGFANCEAAVGQITYQSKILWTAVFSVLILGKKLTQNQWLALVVLATGVLAVQGIDLGGAKKKPAGHGQHQHQHRHGRGTEVSIASKPEQNPLLGIGALIGAAICTSFASVYFEKMLKGASKPSLWLRNIQLASYSSLVALGGLLMSSDESLSQRGWFAGFGLATWGSVIWQAMGGILVAVTIKYADNILRGFAQALALIVGAVGSYFLFDFHISLMFTLGVALVIAAVFIYGSSAQTPQELCESLGGTCAPFVKLNTASQAAPADPATRESLMEQAERDTADLETDHEGDAPNLPSPNQA